ncbi:AAA family ATPase [Oxalicibacterium faecigallinarum]|nr:hypothetical protein [Oxalicibacterium faecigallinarum]
MGHELSDTDMQKSGNKFVFCSSNDSHFQWIKQALNAWQVVHQDLVPLDVLAEQIAHIRPQLVLLDFSGNCRDTEENCAKEMIALAQTLKIRHPNVHQVAVGSSNYADGAVAAMRAGVHHFIDMQSDGTEAREVIRTMITGLPTLGADPCNVITLLGARAGIGTTTLAVHLADMLQLQQTPQAIRPKIALLDFGIPVADGQLYLNVSSTFDLLDAVRNRHRLDSTLVQTAIAHNNNGIRIISLPRTPESMHALVANDVLGLLSQLRAYFDVLIIDLGGFPEQDLTMRIANASDETWLLTDQSVGSLVSFDNLIKSMDKNQVARSKRHLIVTRHEDAFGMSAEQIAERFKVPLKAKLPESRQRLVSAANIGKLLHETTRTNAYLNAVSALAESVLNRNTENTKKGGLRDWLQRCLPGRGKTKERA